MPVETMMGMCVSAMASSSRWFVRSRLATFNWSGAKWARMPSSADGAHTVSMNCSPLLLAYA